MQYPLIKTDSVSGQNLMNNPEVCTSATTVWCIEPNTHLSNGDRDGIVSIYPPVNSQFSVRYLSRQVDDDCILSFGDATIKSETYRFSMTLVDNQNQRTVLKQFPFTLGGSVDIGCGFESANAGRLGTVSNISAFVTPEPQFSRLVTTLHHCKVAATRPQAAAPILFLNGTGNTPRVSDTTQLFNTHLIY